MSRSVRGWKMSETLAYRLFTPSQILFFAGDIATYRLFMLNQTLSIATLIKRIGPERWQALAKPAKRLQQGDRIRFGHESRVCLLGALDATVEQKGEAGEITLRFDFHGAVLDDAIEALGHIPLPPYIASKREDDERDGQWDVLGHGNLP